MTGFVHRSGVGPEKGLTAAHLSEENAPSLECCGCPDDNECRKYCVDNYDARGGYCEGFLDLRCVCIY